MGPLLLSAGATPRVAPAAQGTRRAARRRPGELVRVEPRVFSWLRGPNVRPASTSVRARLGYVGFRAVHKRNAEYGLAFLHPLGRGEPRRWLRPGAVVAAYASAKLTRSSHWFAHGPRCRADVATGNTGVLGEIGNADNRCPAAPCPLRFGHVGGGCSEPAVFSVDLGMIRACLSVRD
jgi:hypothetical protein